MTQRKTLFSVTVLFIFLFSGCKKEGESYEELSQLAQLKIQEAIKLTQDHPCANLDEWRIDTLYSTYVPIHARFEEAYDKLVAEALDLQTRANKVYKNPERYDTSPVSRPPHFGLRCIDGKIKVASALDLGLVEIDEHLDQLFTEITEFFSNVACDDASKWQVYTVRKDCEFVPIVYTQTANFGEFFHKIEQYNYLYAAKRHRDTSLDCSTENAKPAKGVICENGKPKVQY
ncbi:hypothetical protein FAZ19_11365 [Sphingobacterium alkalisoli]|uniref:Lipoprotein n=1 Tax=Sphingobacterium alkalisoli TaxID=1874115 RepID=A0A4U0H288_9SPHI|nr:hypothetical protein [Sphingobacterium alkalisoli]TJY65715.1 hypothetical protein FAZ19_11365 [Sphingobacterium alkalisoli]GGH18771.1 hypothetical protein GCM10011418_22660 [Sphingobacterium alkalisoli]